MFVSSDPLTTCEPASFQASEVIRAVCAVQRSVTRLPSATLKTRTRPRKSPTAKWEASGEKARAEIGLREALMSARGESRELEIAQI